MTGEFFGAQILIYSLGWLPIVIGVVGIAWLLDGDR